MRTSGTFSFVVRVVVALAVLSAPVQTAGARSCCDDARAGAVTQGVVAAHPAMDAHAAHRVTAAAHCVDGGCRCPKVCKAGCTGGAHGGLVDLSYVPSVPARPVYAVTAASMTTDLFPDVDTPPPR